jgi:hypothetical protein
MLLTADKLPYVIHSSVHDCPEDANGERILTDKNNDVAHHWHSTTRSLLTSCT